MMARERLLIALDTPEQAIALGWSRALAGRVGGLKLGLEFFTAHGPDAVRAVVAASGLPLFLDLKFHDIPNTVAGAVRAAGALGPAFLTLHAGGGPAMLRAAAAAAAAGAPGRPRPKLLGVTVLTSLDPADLAAVGQDVDVAAQVLRLAQLVKACGLDGLVCAPSEVAAVRRAMGPGFLLVVPGIRPHPAAGGDDQKRVMTPAAALEAGADYLVIGRPVTGAPDPAAAVAGIVAELGAGSPGGRSSAGAPAPLG